MNCYDEKNTNQRLPKNTQNNKWIAKEGYDEKHTNQRMPKGMHWNFAEDCWSLPQVLLYMLIDFQEEGSLCNTRFLPLGYIIF